MIEKIQHATASSPEGAKGLVKGILACAFQNMAFMLPTGLLYLLAKDLLAGSTSGRSTFYLLGCVACFVLILLTTWFQYNGTYFTTYKESGTRRLTLAERLRKLPLSFFGKRDLADLTSTIMADCEVLEKDCSHFIPGLFGSLMKDGSFSSSTLPAATLWPAPPLPKPCAAARSPEPDWTPLRRNRSQRKIRCSACRMIAAAIRAVQSGQRPENIVNGL